MSNDSPPKYPVDNRGVQAFDLVVVDEQTGEPLIPIARADGKLVDGGVESLSQQLKTIYGRWIEPT